MADPNYRNLNDCLMLHLRKATRRATAGFDRALAPLGLTATQFAILGHLSWAHDRGKNWTVHSLADALAMEASSLTRALQPLQRRGLLTLDPDPEDRRAKRPAATPAGRALFVEACPVWDRVHAALLAQVGDPDAAKLLGLLKQTVAAADLG